MKEKESECAWSSRFLLAK